MPKKQSRRQDRNRTLIAGWQARADSDFTAHGLSRDDVTTAQKGLIGHIVMPGDPAYDAGRMLSNPVYSPAPSMIVYCAAESDVAIALGLARKGNMPFTVRSGGHCTAGFSGGYGVMIDVSGLDEVVVGLPNMQALVGTGCPFGKLNKVLSTYKIQHNVPGAYRLHVPAGECEDVCVGGFVQGGGLGFTSTSFGMNCDNVLEIKVMLADGSIVIANQSQNYDLWWAVRGGTGGNFGVLLSVRYQLYSLGRVLGFALAWDVSTPAGIAQAVDVLMMMQKNYMAGSPYAPNLNLQVLLVWQTILDPQKPPLPKLTPIFMVRGLYVGDIDFAGFESMQAFVQMPGCVVQWAEEGDYDTILNDLLGNPQDQPIIDPAMGAPNEDKASRYVARNLTPVEWSTIFTYFLTQTPNTLSYMYLEFYGGAIATYPMSDSAFVHRDALFNAVLDVFWYKPSDRAASEAFLNGWNTVLETVWNGESYQNYASINVPDYQNAYWGQALHGLVRVKQKYDPDHAFTFAQEVPAKVTPQIHAMPIPALVSAALAQPINYLGGIAALHVAGH